MTQIQTGITYVNTPYDNLLAECEYWRSLANGFRIAAEGAQERDELIETQREVIADLQAQLEAIKVHQAEVRKTTNRNYVTAILRANKFEREAAKWKAIATGAIEDCGE